MIILHGDNTIKSRQALVEIAQSEKAKGGEVQRLSAKSLTPMQLQQALGGVSLFGADQLIVLEELHSLPESAKKKELLTLLAATSTPVVLWEKRELTKTMLKKFPQAEVKSFLASSILFKWLDQLGSKRDKKQLLGEMHQIFATDSAQFLFTMIIRQVRLLIGTLDDGKLKGAPFMINKLRKQATFFTLPQLIQLHTKLLELDYRQKRSLSRLSLEQELDLLLLTM